MSSPARKRQERLARRRAAAQKVARAKNVESERRLIAKRVGDRISECLEMARGGELRDDLFMRPVSTPDGIHLILGDDVDHASAAHRYGRSLMSDETAPAAPSITVFIDETTAGVASVVREREIVVIAGGGRIAAATVGMARLAAACEAVGVAAARASVIIYDARRAFENARCGDLDIPRAISRPRHDDVAPRSPVKRFKKSSKR